MNLRLTSASLRTGIAAVVVAGAVHLAQSRDMVVDFTRPIVLQTLRWCGNEAVDCGEELRVGRMLVPWTRDCAGINLLLILLALAVWVNRKERHAWRFWLCMAAMVPAAAAANVLRVLTLLSYRTLAYPGVESPQTHYFIGFIWLVPFITLITPRDKRPLAAGLMETLHAAAVVSLLAPMAGTPNATLLTLAAVICLAQCRVREPETGRGEKARAGPALGMALWLAAGTGIALVGMESFWLPWLLVCPLLVPPRWVCSVPGMACLACTHSVVVMQPWSWAIAAVGLAWAWRSEERAADGAPGRAGCPQPAARHPVAFEPFIASNEAHPPANDGCLGQAALPHTGLSDDQRGNGAPGRAGCPQPAARHPVAFEPFTASNEAHRPADDGCLGQAALPRPGLSDDQRGNDAPGVAWAWQAAFYACLMFPFLASTLLAIGQQNWEPPAGVESRCISPNCFEIRLRGQPASIGLACYSAASRDRHHTLNVCLKYRGIELTDVPDCPHVLTDGTHWFREFFHQDGQLLADYPSYVRSTLRPWAEPGVHLIFVSAHETQTPAEFSAACAALAQQFENECQGNQEVRVAEARAEAVN